MKKITLAPLALSLLGGAAHAQSSVILYGVVDSAIEYVSNISATAPVIDPNTGAITRQSGGNRFGLQTAGGMSSPRWGLRGEEDLGGGLKAQFVLESGFGIDDGKSQQGGRLFGRQAFLGLQKAGVGTIMLGRQYSSLLDVMANFVPLALSPLYESTPALAGPQFREDNTVKYKGEFGGLVAEAHWSFGAGTPTYLGVPLSGGGNGETPGHFRDNTAYGAGLSYSSGPFGIGLAYDQWNPAVTAGNAMAFKKAAVGARYTIGPALLFAGYRWGQNKSANGDVTLLRDDYYWIGGVYSATSALNLTLAYYYNNLKTVRFGSALPAANLPNPWQATFVADYNLSKRTDVYLTVAYSKNSGLNFGNSTDGFASGYFLDAGSNHQVGAAVGIRHKF